MPETHGVAELVAEHRDALSVRQVCVPRRADHDVGPVHVVAAARQAGVVPERVRQGRRAAGASAAAFGDRDDPSGLRGAAVPGVSNREAVSAQLGRDCGGVVRN